MSLSTSLKAHATPKTESTITVTSASKPNLMPRASTTSKNRASVTPKMSRPHKRKTNENLSSSISKNFNAREERQRLLKIIPNLVAERIETQVLRAVHSNDPQKIMALRTLFPSNEYFDYKQFEVECTRCSKKFDRHYQTTFGECYVKHTGKQVIVEETNLDKENGADDQLQIIKWSCCGKLCILGHENDGDQFCFQGSHTTAAPGEDYDLVLSVDNDFGISRPVTKKKKK
ncbi:unnamed protein product [Didymodactylos carnosus]|uniref:Uncharacterized protein n=1 Tax=Didymodactylos carnosus TaxID=1234261 RepID=A0A814GCF5_9BILA|nr:unnamed protein product [Didymodactylos carnosus]CAF0992688.1 unnamed protein product [Didymodactylos carnosus]CAF3732461.1 unnamed protein product [Didymodactylos carnosus]CAF3764562.1 unnamed protein product [Didymodactylos carnosus]